MTQEIIHAALVLLFIIPTMIAVVFFLKKLNYSSQDPGSDLRIVNQLSLSKKEKIVVVSIENVKLVIGISTHAFNLIHLIDSHDK